jgi:DtxR family transcriptional regulator, Mn-dependent transcriptional regulator
MHLMSSSNRVRRLSALDAGDRGTVDRIVAHHGERVERLLALGVTPGARVSVLQTSPAIVFSCDQTEFAVERSVADAIFVRTLEE